MEIKRKGKFNDDIVKDLSRIYKLPTKIIENIVNVQGDMVLDAIDEQAEVSIKIPMIGHIVYDKKKKEKMEKTLNKRRLS